MADETQYDVHVAKAVRGTEARMIAKWQADGWEVVSQKTGTLRTEITFRRPKKTLALGVLASSVWRAFRGRSPKTQLALAGGLVLLMVAFGVAIGLQQGDRASKPAASPTTKSAAPSSPTSAAPSNAASPATTRASTPATSTPTDADQPLTVDNSRQLAALLKITDTCTTSIATFAAEHAGEQIEFNGSVGALNKHDDYQTRYDILIGAGDFSTTTSRGPAFQLRNVGISDLHLEGSDAPDSVGVGDNVHIVAEVRDYIPNQCLFLLDPVSTRMR